MKKTNIIMIILLISMLAGCGNENVSVEFSEEKNIVGSTEEISVVHEKSIYVYISGQVKKPGVYQISSDARVFEVIKQAGGFTKKAKTDYINQAEPVSDGQSIYVMSKKEYQATKSPSQNETNQSKKESSDSASDSGKVDINSATEQELMTLPGIGSSKAKAIIEYREINGRFTKIEDLKKVSGIGEATFSNLESMIAVD